MFRLNKLHWPLVNQLPDNAASMSQALMIHGYMIPLYACARFSCDANMQSLAEPDDRMVI